jgi:hypothetical protein
MSYDKYIKYKSKYLQLKAKYTQVGGGRLWVITNLHQFGDATTQITQIESDAINRQLPYLPVLLDKSKNIIPKTLTDDKGNLINNYGYTINSDGNTGTRNSIRGNYNMKLKNIKDSPASTAPSSHSVSSAYGSSAPASSAHVYALPSTPRSASGAYGSSASAYAPPPRSAYGAPPPLPLPPSDIPTNLSNLLQITKQYNKDNIPLYEVLSVTNVKLSLMKVGEKLIIDGVSFDKVNDTQINMKYNKVTYPLLFTDKHSKWSYIYKYKVVDV